MKDFIIEYEVLSIRGVEYTQTCVKEGKSKKAVREEFEKNNPKNYFRIVSIIQRI